MENASKALIMAAGILVAIIIIGALAVTMRTVGAFQRTNLSETEEAEIVAYNEQYTKYVGEYMYGTEIMTLINRHINSINNQSIDIYPIKVNVDFIEGYTYKEIKRYRDGRTEEKDITVNKLKLDIDETTGYYISSLTTSDDVDSFRNRAFKCTGVGYGDNGRINEITFKEIKWK